METRSGIAEPPKLFMSELVPHKRVAGILSDNELQQLTLAEIVANREMLKGGSYWLRDDETLPQPGSYEITDLKEGRLKPASKERLGNLEWNMIVQVEKYHKPHRPMSIEVCGQEGIGKVIVSEASTMFETVSGVVGRKLPPPTLVSSTPIHQGEFLEIALGDGSRRRVYGAKEVRVLKSGQMSQDGSID